ncbi:MAG: zinc-binding alcohol dehydrogenase family protein [Microbacteriaceae bacterium]|nr:zinc-binding alcohol dehydrogenase family protein [Microbacteriaceae bacterium]
MSKNTQLAIGYKENLPVTTENFLVERQVAVPEIGPRDLLVEVAAVSVNPIDTKVRQNAPAEQLDGFRVLGFDAAGMVKAVGSEVTLFQTGDEVFYTGTLSRPGTNQRLHAVDERIVGRKPQNLSFADAAALPLVSITAWECLFDRLRLTAASRGTLLVVGATGGVGSIVVQLAKALLPQVKIIATASSERAGFMRKLGATHTVNHRENLAEQVIAVAPDGVDWIFTSYSPGQAESFAQVIKPAGQIVAIDEVPGDLTAFKAKSVAWLWESMFTRPEFETPDMIEQHRLLNKVASLVEKGQILPIVAETFSPINAANLRQAHILSEKRHTLGKIVLHDWE